MMANLKALNQLMDKKFPQLGVAESNAGGKKQYMTNQNHQKAQFNHKTVRNNYGEFYKNLMKPQGGQFVDKLTGNSKRSNSIFILDGPLQSRSKNKLNPIQQLATAKNSFVQMINVLSNSDQDTIGDDDDIIKPPKFEPKKKHFNNQTINASSIGNEDSYINAEQNQSNFQDYKKKIIDNSLSISNSKNLSFDKSSIIYKDYLKEQGQKSLQNLHKSLSQSNQNNNLMIKERIAFKNHLKMFKEDSKFVEEFNRINEEMEVQENQASQDQSKPNLKPQPILLNCFKDLEQRFGRQDTETFNSLINDLLSGRLQVSDLVSKEDLDKVSKHKFYTGYSLAPEVRQTLKQSLEDEYQLKVEELEEQLRDSKYYNRCVNGYKNYLKRYRDAQKEQKDQKDLKEFNIQESTIEAFKNHKASQKIAQQTSDSIVKPADRHTAFVVYMAIQEMIKQVFVECRQKGRLFWKLFRRYFKEQEHNWFSILQELTDQIRTLKYDRAFLLNKFVDKKSSAFLKENLNKIVDNKDLSEQNLIDHKRVIMELIGFVNQEEDTRYLMEVQSRSLEKDIKDIVYNWDLVRANLDFKERIKKVNTQKIKEEFNLMDQVRALKRDDQAILVNLERMRLALSNNNSVNWDLEKIQLQGQNHFYREENQIMKQEMKRVRELLEQSQESLQERSKENFDLAQRLKKFTQNLDIVVQVTQDIQTDVSFKNEEFTTSLDQILKNKLSQQVKKVQKLMNKAKANVNKYEPMSKQEMMDLIQGIYIKKSQEINTKNELYREFDDFVYSVLIQRFGTKKKADHKGQEFMLALKKYAKEDDRVDFFKKFLGFEEQRPYSREVLEFYIMLMKATNESIQNLMSAPHENSQHTPCERIYLEFNLAFDKYLKVFNNSSHTLKEELKKHLIFDSDLIIENQPRIEVKLNEKWELYAMLVFLKNTMNNQSSNNIEQAIVERFGIDEESNLSCTMDNSQFEAFFISQIGADDTSIIFSVLNKQDFFQKYFGVLQFIEADENSIDKGKKLIKIRGFKKLFRERYEFKISLRKFLDLGMKMSIRFSEEAKEYYGKIFKVFDADGDGFITFKEFRKIIKKVDPSRSDWKIHAIFQKSTGVDNSDKGQLKFEEFIKCAMNNVLMEHMIDWEKVLLEDREEQKKDQDIENQLRLIANKPKGNSTMKLKTSARQLGGLSPNSAAASRPDSNQMSSKIELTKLE